jgi:probable rRNA maturation factor
MQTDRDGIEIDVSNTQAHLRVEPDALAGLAERVLRGEGISRASVSITLVDDATIHEINREHLAHDWSTDVITFKLSDDNDPVLAGELVISAEMAASTANSARCDPQAELSLYVIHGLLHLCGLDDGTPADAAAMRRREAEVLAREGLTNTFALGDALPAGSPGEGGQP